MSSAIRISKALLALGTLALLAPGGAAQVYVNAPGNIPQGAPFNNSMTEQVDFADVDLDGDWDVGIADGGDFGNDQSRLWINLGGLQAGTAGFFADETAARLPASSHTSRDIEFVDFDGDGDPDVHLVNTADISNQSARWWVNLGGLQGGTLGYYADETAARWVGLGGPGSSIPPSMVLPSGGFIHWAQEHSFADLDADGDMDLIAASTGGSFGGNEPTRVFLNDGAGFFSEFNPSGVQLSGTTIPNGSPGLWCQGTQLANTTNTTGSFCDIATIGTAVDAADEEGDFDLDFLLLDRMGTPRMFRNLSELGPLSLRDVTGLTWPNGYGGGNAKYEQDFGDLDGDGDLDLYGVNWSAPYFDATLRNAGDGTFVAPTAVAGTTGDEDDADFVDFDADGDLDVFVAGFSGFDALLRNDFAGGALVLTLVSGAVQAPPATARDIDAADVDQDGDYDVLKGNDGADQLLLNVLNAPDDVAPRLPLLEQPEDHGLTGLPTRIRAHVLDNAPDYVTGYQPTQLSYSVDGAPFQSVPMRWSGAQVFRGELPASALGNVRYRALSTDEHGNQGQSALKNLNTAGGCSGSASTYCTGKLNSQGCIPAMSFLGSPSASLSSGFLLSASNLVPGNNGIFFYSKTGPAFVPFQGGILCVAAPVIRTTLGNTGGAAACSGTLAIDFNAWIASGADPGLGSGSKVWIQAWLRDPVSATGTSLSDGVTFTVCQ